MNSKVSELIKLLDQTHPDAECELNFGSPFELLIATILSAQTTDKKVNSITERLFKKYKTPEDFLNLTQESLESELKELGLFRNKAKNILSTCKILVDQFNGVVPSSREELMLLPGVGRKTANVVLSNAFNVPAMAVDTHVLRLSNRLGLANSEKPEDVEEQLTSTLPLEKLTKIHHQLIWHGRRVCFARRPNCSECTLKLLCPSSTPLK